jgi:hypothetical protein
MTYGCIIPAQRNVHAVLGQEKLVTNRRITSTVDFELAKYTLQPWKAYMHFHKYKNKTKHKKMAPL